MAKKLSSQQISRNAAAKTWTQPNLMGLASAWSALNNGATPPGVPAPPDFNPYASPVYAPQLAANNTGLANTYTDLGVTFDAQGNPVYGGGAYFSGAQNFGIDENGNPIAQGDSRYNPFSQANMMKQAFENRKNATVNGYAASGQLYSGALNNQQTADATNYAQGYNALERNAKNYYGDLVSKARSARDTANLNTATITGNALQDNLNHQGAAPVLKPNLGPKPAKSLVPRVIRGFRQPLSGSRR